MDGMLIAQAVLYFGIFLFGMITSISSGVARYNFGGNCILYGSAEVTNATTAVVHPAYGSVCTFLPAGNLFVGVLFGFCAFCYHVYYIHKSKMINRAAYRMGLKGLLFIACLATFVTLVAGGALSVGLSDWCGSVMDSIKTNNLTQTTVIKSCSDTQFTSINWTISAKEGEMAEEVTAGEYYNEYSIAQVTVWLSFVLWFCQLICCAYRVYRKSKIYTTYQDPFVIDPMDSFS